jgi:hypothetical protein
VSRGHSPNAIGTPRSVRASRAGIRGGPDRADARGQGMSYFALQEDLEELFRRPVDLVPKDGLHRVIRDQVPADPQVLYAA